MGAFIVMDVGFASVKDRVCFEKKWSVKREDVLIDEKSDSGGFTAWTMVRNPELHVVYFMGFMGYAEPKTVLRESLKDGICVKFLSWIPINDRNACWEKLRGRW